MDIKTKALWLNASRAQLGLHIMGLEGEVKPLTELTINNVDMARAMVHVKTAIKALDLALAQIETAIRALE